MQPEDCWHDSLVENYVFVCGLSVISERASSFALLVLKVLRITAAELL
jgi:hypothetical protein